MRLNTLKKQLILSFLTIIFTILTGFSQVKNYNISVKWQPIQNNYEGKNQSLSVLSILNGSENDLPPTGWSLYFNYGADILKPDSRGLTMSFINGDLYKIEPNAASDGISAGVTINFQMIQTGSTDNVTQSPQGFYIVFDDLPNKAVPVKCTIPILHLNL